MSRLSRRDGPRFTVAGPLVFRLPWRPTFLALTAISVAVTVVLAARPPREGTLVSQVVWLLSLQSERSIATWAEGIGFLLVALLAFERLIETPRADAMRRLSWFGLMVLSTGFSVDELSSIHERAGRLIFGGAISGVQSHGVLAVLPALLLVVTLVALARAREGRRLTYTALGSAALASVVGLEVVEYHVAIPPRWVAARFGLEEGLELLGLFLFLHAVLWEPAKGAGGALRRLAPSAAATAALRGPVGVLGGLFVLPIALFSSFVVHSGVDAPHASRGMPHAWLSACALVLCSLTASHAAVVHRAGRAVLIAVCAAALFFSVDRVVLFQRAFYPEAGPGENALDWAVGPVLAGLGLIARWVGGGGTLLLLGAAALTLLLTLPLPLWARFAVVPLQALLVFVALADGPLRRVETAGGRA